MYTDTRIYIRKTSQAPTVTSTPYHGSRVHELLQVMQLFTIGTVQLTPEGSIKLDSEGSPIPNYNNEDLEFNAQKRFRRKGVMLTLSLFLIETAADRFGQCMSQACQH